MKLLYKILSQILNKRHLQLVYSLNFRKKTLRIAPNLDYIRTAFLELCYDEIISKNIPGNVAELGVYQGEFAKKINLLFLDRKLYLFDTFEGFHPEDIEKDTRSGYSDGKQDFSKTSVESVLKLMKYPDNCIICKGHFPATAKRVDDIFCFVNLDADLYEPIYEGLKFFYPRLSKGGYILVHDYNNDDYLGVRKAVHQYCNENNINYVPLPDIGGSVIITK